MAFRFHIWNGLISVEVYWWKGCVEEDDMDKRDWELLDKQIRSPQPAPPPNGVMVTMLAGIFIRGVTIGALFSAPEARHFRLPARILNGPVHETPR